MASLLGVAHIAEKQQTGGRLSLPWTSGDRDAGASPLALPAGL